MFAAWAHHRPNSAYYASGGILSADYKLRETGRFDLYMLSRTQETETGGLFKASLGYTVKLCLKSKKSNKGLKSKKKNQ